MSGELSGYAQLRFNVIPCLLALLFGGWAIAGLSIVSARAERQPKVEKTLRTFDLTPTVRLDARDPAARRRIWDETHFVTSVQGIVNRNRPRLYVYLVGGNTGSTDHFWMDRLRERGEWLADWTLQPLPDLKALVRAFRRDINGLVVYDPRVPATSNVASTVAGVEGLACVRYDPSSTSLYRWLTDAPEGPKLPVKVRLLNPDGSPLFTGRGALPGSATPSSGSAKCDAYLWAKERYLDTGRCDASKMAYYLDAYWIDHPEGYIPNHTLSNHDYYISHKAFFFDLLPWDDETPVDDRSQPLGADAKTLCALLRSAWNRSRGKTIISVGGFVPWAWKYTDFHNTRATTGRPSRQPPKKAPESGSEGAGGSHGGVPTEWRYAEILSCFNACMDADAIGLCAMANASVHTFYPLAKRYPQHKPTLADLKSRGYVRADGTVARKSFVAIYGGDYDAASWLYQRLPEIWNDPARGTIPVGWAFNPNLADRFATGMAWARKTASGSDTFVAGDSGAGYLNPGSLVPPRRFSGLPSGLPAWTDRCRTYYARWDLSLTGFVIDGYAPAMTDAVKDAYALFSPDGIIGQKVPRVGMHKGMPVLRMSDDLNDPTSGTQTILAHCGVNRPEFFVYRTILWSPSNLKKMMDQVKQAPDGGDVEFVDPYTLMLLVKQHYNGPEKGVSRALTAPLPPPGQEANLWNVRYGNRVTGHSALVPGCDPRDLFGGSFGSLESHDLILFADDKPEGFTHWIEWKTVRPMRLESIKLFAHGDDNSGRREFLTFRIYAKDLTSGHWDLIDAFSPAHPYTFEQGSGSSLHSYSLPRPVTAQQFRAEFIQGKNVDSITYGPRVVELMGIGTLTGQK